MEERTKQRGNSVSQTQASPDSTQMIEWTHLGKSEYFPLPVEPLYDLQVAANLIPMHPPSLRKLLSRHKRPNSPPATARSTGGRRIRLLSASEIRRIRPMVVKDANPDPHL